jgi:uncharacterized protein YecT (DUF1311 family)
MGKSKKYMVWVMMGMAAAFSSGSAQLSGDLCQDEIKHPGKIACLKAAFAREERDLQKAYDGAFVYIKNSDAKRLVKNYWETALQKAQKQWVKYREKDCADPVNYEHGGGTAGELAVLYCLIHKTRERAKELESRYRIRKAETEAPGPVTKPASAAVPAAPQDVKAPIVYARVFKSTASANPLEKGCPGTVRVTASSDLENRVMGQHSVGSLIDKNVATAWLAGTQGRETGAWVQFEVSSLAGVGTDSIVYTFQVINGHAFADSTWSQSARVQEMSGYYNGKLAFIVHLEDSKEFQEFNFGLVQGVNKPRYKKGDKVKFVISKIYPGTKNRNVYLSTLVPKCI